MVKKMKIVITGGHFTPALAVIEELGKRGGWDIYWIGEKKALGGSEVATLEYRILPNLHIPAYFIPALKLQRRPLFSKIISFVKFPVSLIKSFLLSFAALLKIKPAVVLSFGSYVSLPVVLASWFLRIPVVIHEQTPMAGLANRLAAHFARYVAISNNASRNYFPRQKTVLTGNPVRRAVYRIANKAKKKRNLIYITGGSRGAQRINRIVFKALPSLLEISPVVHQTGAIDLGKALRVKNRLKGNLRGKYYPTALLTPGQVDNVYSKAALVISRAGANTVSELEVLGIPAILIPIPWVQNNEQYHNARGLERLGNGVLLSEEELSEQSLLGAVRRVLANSGQYAKKKARTFLARRDASGKLVDIVTGVVPRRIDGVNNG